MQVSIIIPVYNVAPYIEKCLQSVMAQTYSESMECLLVDDCGRDESMTIAEHCIEEYKLKNRQNSIEFHILHHSKNRGLSAARNTGIENARGEWLYFLDSDDWIIPECIGLMMQRVKQYPKSEAVFAGAFNSRCWMDYEKKDLPDYSENRRWIQDALLQRTYLCMTAWNKLIKKSFIVCNHCFFKENLILEDELWNLLLAQNLSCLSIVKLNTYHYVDNSQSIIAEIDKDAVWDRNLKLWNAMIDEVKGYRVDVQVKAICKFILDLTINYGEILFPCNRRWDLFYVYCRLAAKHLSKTSLFLFMQGVCALFYNKRYCNVKITKRLLKNEERRRD